MDFDVFRVQCTRIRNTMWYSVWFPYNIQLIERVKELPREHKKYNSNTKSWDLNVDGLYSLIKRYRKSKNIYFDFGGDDSKKIFIDQVEKIKKQEKEKEALIADLEIKKQHWIKWKLELEENYHKYIDLVHKNLKGGVKLYPHQVVGTMFLNEVRSGLLALDIGLGKTLSSIAYVEMNDFEKVFVVTPNNLKFNYYNEVEKFTESKAHIIGYKKNKYSIDESKYVIVNYEYFNPSNFKSVKEKFRKLNLQLIDCLIFDECHRIKSTKSNTTKAIKKLFNNNEIFRNKKSSRVFMSGTPMMNRSYELFSVMNFISPIDFPNKTNFQEYYCGMHYNTDTGLYEYDNALMRLEDLFVKISPYTYRKKKRDVLKDLPDVTYQKVIFDMTKAEMDIYNDIEEGIANEFFNENITNPLVILNRLREYLSQLKAKYIKDLIDSILESDEKLVIIDFFKKGIIELNKQYPTVSALHTGDQKMHENAETVRVFQDENSWLKVFLGSEGTAREGITLTAASKIGVLTIPWNREILEQIVGRLDRIGAKNAINAYIFMFRDTIDEKIYYLIVSKKSEVSGVIDGQEYKSDVQESVMDNIVGMLKNKYSRK
jgi:SNF2 family DNA or RNA helicase